MIEPREISPFELVDGLRLGIRGVMFISFNETKYLLYHNNLCVFEVITGSIPQGYYISYGGKYQAIDDIFSFVENIRPKYPDVADWFLFNIKKFS